MDITLTLNERDFSGRVSNYEVTHEPIPSKIITTLDSVEHVTINKFRTVIKFRLIPSSDETANDDYTALSAGVFAATYTDPQAGGDRSQTVRLTTNLSAAFGLRSIDGNRYYKGGEITLRATSPGLGEEPEEEQNAGNESDV